MMIYLDLTLILVTQPVRDPGNQKTVALVITIHRINARLLNIARVQKRSALTLIALVRCPVGTEDQ